MGLDLAGPARVGREATALARLVGGGQVVRLALFEGEVELASLEDVAVDGDVLLPLPFTPRASGFLDLRLAVEVTDGVDPRGGDLVFERCVPVDDPLRVSAPRRNKTVASTAQGLRAGLLRRGVGLTSRKGNTTGRTPRTGRQKGERPSWA